MTLDDIMDAHRKRFAPYRRWVIVEIGSRYEVHEWAADGVAPPSDYGTKREAASRLLQLMRIGPVAPQTWPEEVCVGRIETEVSP